MAGLTIVQTEMERGATVSELALINFAGVEDLKGKTDKELSDLANTRTRELYNMSYLALAQMRLGKDKLIEVIREDDNFEVWFEMLKGLAAAQSTARCLLEFFTSAEARLMVAMSAVY